jgi:hypothetical protein
MSAIVALSLTVALTAAVDPTTARARARQNEAALAAAEAALAAGDASAALAAVLPVDEGDRRLDRRRLQWVRGRARLGVGDVAAARDDLAAVFADPPAGAVDAVRRAFADAERSLGHFDACADVLAGLVAVTDDDRLQWATCLRGTTRRPMAHDVLADGASVAVQAWRVHLWIEDGAPRAARADAFALATSHPPPEVLAWARAFHDGGDPAAALILVDALLGRDDLDELTADAAARVLARGGRARVQRASLLAPSLADARRDAGDVEGAWRASITLDGVDRFRQRAALLVDAGAWERLWLLWPRLRAAGLGDDDEVAYAVAFAAFTTGRLAEAEAVLDGVNGQATFARATALRAEIKTRQACRVVDGKESPCSP